MPSALGLSGTLLIAASLVGCSGVASESDKTSSNERDLTSLEYSKPSNAPDIKSATIPTLPIEGYLVSQKEKEQILKASRMVAKSCMARFGFSYSWSAASGQRVTSDDNASNRSRRYGIVDSAAASKYGYGLGADNVQGPSEQAPSAAMSEAATRVFLGNSDPTVKVESGAKVNGQKIPEGGCAGEAKRKIGNGLSNRAANDINMASFTVSLNDEKVKAVLGQWSQCMQKRGYDFNSPLDPLKTMGAGSATPREKVTADADVQCKYETNLIGIWNSVESAIQKAMIGKKEEILEEGRRETDRSVRNASTVLSGDSR
ncbi:hypothetical protein [Streptomyces sp. P9(2023)]|uniref:hypothetical protein n=1 Tax=Streptomyces sp. P9(2023) TaxID=3064394 RepID=UPI0028F4155F|nr:hypothetical protein [Streptomyces sp. P9(2023)]